MKKASIIIPCYNAEKYIEKTVNSALSQDYENIEVIVVDNESTDNSYRIVNNINDDRLQTSIAKNIYPFCWDEAREKGFQIATGEYFFTLAADDLFRKDYVSNCMKYINSGKGKIKAFQSSIRGFQNNINNCVNEVSNKYKSLSEFKQMSLTKCMVNSPTVVYHHSLFDDGLLKTEPDKYSGAADYDLSCKLADKGVFIYPSPVWLGYYYRWHEEQATWEMHKLKDKINYDDLIQTYWREKWN